MTYVKICGCMSVEDALAAKEAGADFVGLMFAPASRRRLTSKAAREIVDALGDRSAGDVEPPLPTDDVIESFRHGADALERLLDRKRPLTVGVFEDQPIDEVNTIADEVGLDLVQFSGHESWDYCRLSNRPVVKAIDPRASAGRASAGRASAGRAGADAVIDALEPGLAVACMLDVSRGRGLAVDRELASAVASRMPIWLAGGLSQENVSDAVREVRPWAVDVSSGVETDRAKDADKIRAFVSAAKGALVS